MKWVECLAASYLSHTSPCASLNRISPVALFKVTAACWCLRSGLGDGNLATRLTPSHLILPLYRTSSRVGTRTPGVQAPSRLATPRALLTPCICLSASPVCVSSAPAASGYCIIRRIRSVGTCGICFSKLGSGHYRNPVMLICPVGLVCQPNLQLLTCCPPAMILPTLRCTSPSQVQHSQLCFQLEERETEAPRAGFFSDVAANVGLAGLPGTHSSWLPEGLNTHGAHRGQS